MGGGGRMEGGRRGVRWEVEGGQEVTSTHLYVNPHYLFILITFILTE